MKVTDIISITELSRIMNKSRPTIYKYISDYEKESFMDIPLVVKELFDSIVKKDFSKKDIYVYCDTYFGGSDQVSEVIQFIKENKSRIDFERLMHFLRKEVR